ncbi:hypothetical protein Plhal304r1_c030g0098311 [Plasmopara halstedii]
MYSQRRGRLVQYKCRDYCAHILDKVDEFYDKNEQSTPFIYVGGSSGMGRSQRAFALGDRRPWYYCQLDPVLNVSIAILPQYRTRLLRFNVKPCYRETVFALFDKIKAEKNVLPSFVLDEMSFNENIESGGMNTAAFQRNVFRACGLVVIVMGTDTKMTKLLEQVKQSSGVEIRWFALVSVFPSYQIVLNTLDDQQTWLELVAKYPVVQDIVMHSRARFARYFMKRAVKFVVETSEVELRRLLDDACAHVSLRTHE